MDPDTFLCQLATVFSGVTVNSSSFFAEIALLSAILLLFVSGFTSASEKAFFSLSTSDLNSIGLGNNLSDRTLSSLLAKSNRLLATIHVAKMFVNVAIIMLCNAFFLEVFSNESATLTGVLIFTFALTIVLLLFSEIISKIYSAQHTLSFCRFAAPIITVLEYLFLPIVLILIRSNTYTNKYLARKSYGL